MMQRRKRLHTVLQTYYVNNWVCLKPKVCPPAPFSFKGNLLISKKSYSVFSKLVERSSVYGSDKGVDVTRGGVTQRGETERVITPNGEAPLDGTNAQRNGPPPQLGGNTQWGDTSEVKVSQGAANGLAGGMCSPIGEEVHVGPNAHSGVIPNVGELAAKTDPLEACKKDTNEGVVGEKKTKTKKKNVLKGKPKGDGAKRGGGTLRGGPPNCPAPVGGEKQKKKSHNGKKEEKQKGNANGNANAKKKPKKKRKQNCQNDDVEVDPPRENERAVQRGAQKAPQESEGDKCVRKKFSKDDYYKQFEMISKNGNILMEKMNQVEDISNFVHKHLASLHFGNIYAYNNLLYEIYDKFVDGDIKKVKKLIKNYSKLVKKNLQRKIKYFEAFHNMCPQEYSHVLTCLFIQSIDLLKDEDISHTFNYDQVMCTSRDAEGGGALPQEEEEEEEAFSNLEGTADRGEAGDGPAFCGESGHREGEAGGNVDVNADVNADGDVDRGERGGKKAPRALYQQRQFSPSNKIVYEMDVHFDEGDAGEVHCPGEANLPREVNETSTATQMNQNNFIIVYNLPIINYDLLRAELKEAFSFCGEIKNVEFFSDRLKTVDINALNDQAERESFQNVKSPKSKKVGSIRSGNAKGGKSNQARCTSGKKVQNSFNLNSYTQLYAIVEFFEEKSATLATSEFLRIFGIFCFNKLVYVDKCVNKNIMVITHLPFHLNIYNIFYLLLNASLLKWDVLSEGGDGKAAPKLGVSKGGNCLVEGGQPLGRSIHPGVPSDGGKPISQQNRNRRCKICLRNSNIRIESCDSIFGEANAMSSGEAYDYICEISKRNFLQFKKRKNIKLEAWANDDDSATEGKNNNFESFADFYQNQNKKMKTRKVNVHNNGRILILHFDSFKHLYDCLKKFKQIFGKKNHMIFSVNLRRCIYRNGAIRDCVQVKDGRVGRGLNVEV
ncbi:hypothetical protein PVNG_04965 [Plasmodium vivax North Korean]|uniref:RRM domain-containing protein n=1 Tax=Plasmodium vivax North Korean TaxID=1035514 RepID=A0A0J9U269_PLAVI|nr:hypothetical protein PVNG_05473 [Plasmodium vivax North Korean]KNA01267.1 hypothetical protein PVNG_04965 [Plasmodium vivax North Korean]